MKNLGILIGIVLLLVVFGAISARLAPSAPVLVQTADPNGSVLAATPEQANQLFFWIVFVLINLVGAGVTLALVMWFLGRSINHARALPNNPPALLNRSSAQQLASSDATQLPDKTA